MQLKTDSVALLDIPCTPTRANASRVDESGPDSSPMAAPKKIGFVSLGCPKNLVDSEVMMGLLAAGGAQITTRAEDADVIVVNTCSFIESAKQESVDAILEMAQHKTAGRAQKLIVAGCLVERYRNEIQKDIPEVDAVVGTGELQQILSAAGIASPSPAGSPFVILNSRSEGDAREAAGRFSKGDWDGAIADLPNYLYDENTPRLLATPRYSAYIKIAEGCDHPCSFCIIPQLRGKFRSRRFESVIAEAERLAEQGVREITLIGQDTTCYGEDLGLKDGLALLLERLAQIEKLRWVRFLYAYPNKITGKLLQTIAAHETRRRRRHIFALGGKDAARDFWADAAHFVHRRLPWRESRRFRTALPVRARGPIRLAGSVWLLRRRGGRGVCPGRQSPAKRDRKTPQEAHVHAEADQPQEEACSCGSAVRFASLGSLGRNRVAVGRPD